MGIYLKGGWRSAVRQPFLLFILFSYRLGWGFLLYTIVQSIVEPLLKRYPGKSISAAQDQLFWAESQFQLTKTNFIDSYVWLFFGLLIARMILNPLLNAGIYYSLRQTHLHLGYRFFKGIRVLGASYFLLYGLQMLLTLGPLYWLFPLALQVITKSLNYETAVRQLFPHLIGFLVYGYLLHLGFMYLQFGKAATRSLLTSINAALRGSFTILAISLLLIITSLLIGLLALTMLWFWAGFWAFLLYQTLRLGQTFVDLWAVASQHEIYVEKTR